eukprot:651093-Karenia_brevis.AAC.1
MLAKSLFRLCASASLRLLTPIVQPRDDDDVGHDDSHDDKTRAYATPVLSGRRKKQTKSVE